MKAKELAELLLIKPDLDVIICTEETVWIYGNEKIYRTIYKQFQVNFVQSVDGVLLQIECL